MKNYLLIFALLLMFGLLIAGCGNRTPQSSNDEILDDVTQNLNVEKINNTLELLGERALGRGLQVSKWK